MAILRILPEKDAFVNSAKPYNNSGRDEIVEIGKYTDPFGVVQESRIAVSFDTDEISTLITKYGINNYSASVLYYFATGNEVPSNFQIKCSPISGSWINGTGKFDDLPNLYDGISWTSYNNSTSSVWTTPGVDTYNVSSSVDFKYNQELDIRVDVTSFISSSLSNNLYKDGYLLQLNTSSISETGLSTYLKYYSRETNTVYTPGLELKWDDSVYNTGSLSVLEDQDITINISNNKPFLKDSGVHRVRLHNRPTYPPRTFSTSSLYVQNYVLPENSYWGIKDEYSEEMFIDFDEKYTKISCDSKGSFLSLHLDSFQPERYYRLLVKTTLDGSDLVIDTNNIIKVVRNV